MAGSSIWNTLAALGDKAKDRPTTTLFTADPTRLSRFSAALAYNDPALDQRQAGFHFDFSKTNIDPDALDALLALAETSDLTARREAMFCGARINETEGRAVLHTMMRGTPDPALPQDWQADHLATRARMQDFARAVRSGDFAGPEGPYTDIINIGIGGSDLGPVMACLALAPYHDGPRTHFLSNIDGAHAADLLRPLNPATTLVIIASKTFTTIETMTNAETVRAWLSRAVKDPAAQLVAVSSALDKTAQWGIPPERVFGFGEFIGGRFSVWGPVGLSVMLAIGPERFDDFLAGATHMDRHFREAPFAQNLPVLHALVGIWHNQICGYGTKAVLPYDQRLSRLPAYLQQLEMESNGKSVAMDGTPLPHGGGPVVWGEPGTNGQHAFYQLIHQGSRIVPCEFMIAAEGHEPDLSHQHRLLIANCLAQSEALMCGRSFATALAMMQANGLVGAEAERQAHHRVFSGNRPSVTMVWQKTTPFLLGMLIALYEHRVFVEGVLLGLNSFDQWGVELGKELALDVEKLLAPGADDRAKDASTRYLLGLLRKQ